MLLRENQRERLTCTPQAVHIATGPPQRVGALTMMRMSRALLISAFMGATITSVSRATDLLIKDGDTLQLNGTTYRLDGIDAPERD